MKIFEINKFLSVKLESRKTNIYINGKKFIQCKFLLLFIPKNNPLQLEEIDSIDKASEQLDFSLNPDIEYVDEEKQKMIDGIKPEDEFWAHCSNLQAWAEHDYDTRILHSNLALPLLKRLAEEGDPIAKRKFKEEIAKRYFTGVESVQIFLEEEGYLDYLSKEEIRSFIHSGVDVIVELEEILGKDLLVSTQNMIFKNIIIRNGEIIRLNLSHLNLKKLPDCIQKLKHLEILYLVGNELEEIPEWIGKLQSLKQLDAVTNKIKKIPESIGKLKSLEFLKLSNNQIEELPESIGNLTSLKELGLNTNKIKFLPKSIGNLRSLKKLFISKNLLLSLPESIGNFNKLQTLKLGKNPLKTLPPSICNLSLLQNLSIRATNIKKENNIILNSLKKKKVNIYF